MISREKLVQNSVTKSKKFINVIDGLNAEIKVHEDALNNIDGDIYQIKMELQEISNNEKLVLTKIEGRNSNLNKNMELHTEAEMDKHKQENEKNLKQMKSIFGLKYYEKYCKTFKENKMNEIILDHSKRKNRVNEFFKIISTFELNQQYLYSSMDALENSFKQVLNG